MFFSNVEFQRMNSIQNKFDNQVYVVQEDLHVIQRDSTKSLY